MRLVKIGLVVFLIAIMFLFVNPIYADEESEMKVDLEIDGELEVDIDAKGLIDLDVDAKGPSRIQIDADDEVNLNINADDESQVFTGVQKIDNPVQTEKPLNYQKSKNIKPAGSSERIFNHEKTVLILIGSLILILGFIPLFFIKKKKKN